jgi:t-SNARE complex subunit (syntaxin)
MPSNSARCRKLEQKVTEVAKLMSMFSEKVTEQHDVVEDIQALATDSVEAVKKVSCCQRLQWKFTTGR